GLRCHWSTRTSPSRSTRRSRRTCSRTMRSRTRMRRSRRPSNRAPDRRGLEQGRSKTMGKEQEGYRKLTREELEKLAGEPLPERAAMSLINANVAAPINAALALNVLSDNSVAYANAEQTGNIDQSI